MKNKTTWLLAALYVLVGCTTMDDGDRFEPLREPVDRGSMANEIFSEEEAPEVVRESDVPQIPFTESGVGTVTDDVASKLRGEEISANFRNMPLPEFINEIYGEQLGFNYVLDPALTGAQDLVTLSLTNPIPPSDLYRAARTVLGEYGVSIVETDDLLRFRRDDSVSDEIPLLVTGTTLPDVPATQRPVFAFILLDVVRNNRIMNWMLQLFSGTPLSIQEAPVRNAIVLRGPVELVRQATEVVKMLDRPLMKGKYSKAFTPTYVDPRILSNDLVNVLNIEGYQVSTAGRASSIILPLESQGRIIIFAPSRETLNHILEWAYELDAKKQEELTQGFFSYKAQNVTAEHIAGLIGLLKGGAEGGGRIGTGGTEEGGNDGRGASAYLGGKLVVDNNRNVIFFNGSGQEWREMLTLIEQVDKAVPMVVIDVLLAEITLSGQEESGIEWLFRSSGPLGTDVTGSTFGGLGLGSSGLSLTFDSAGETRAIINAFYSNDRAVIRSSPKLLVKSGENAVIEVGNEIPIITSNSQSVDTPGAPVIQTIQYRKTGVLLSINPIVQASGMVDLVITQELSEQATASGTSVSGSPTILNRRVNTSLALKDGGSVLLGGLISSSKSRGKQGVTGLGNMPVLGKLFRTDIETDARTELLMLVSVYVLDSHEDAVDISETLRERLEIPFQ